MLTELDAVLAETRTFNDELEGLIAAQPAVETLPPEVSRAARREGRGIFPPPVFLPQARELAVPRRDGGKITLRVLSPQRTTPTGVYFHIHGGGWVFGAADLQDVRLAELAETTGLCAVSVEYRLAPEHPYPAGPNDCEDAALWLLQHGPEQLEAPELLTIGGESAGAHLAVVTLLRLRDRHGVSGAFRAANLVYGVFDLAMTPSQRLWRRNLVLSPGFMHWCSGCFLPGSNDEQRRDPDVSPLYADLRALPPALFTVGTLDPLLDDTLFMEARWRQAGNESQLHVYPEAIHGFTLFPLEVARQANAEQDAFLTAAVS